jgi:predicted CDP-diglyceride synthetase/phosphatidate cytidylyltransferase
MSRLQKRFDDRKTLFGDLMVVAFLLMQCLDGVFTYLGVGIWGPGIEANPLISSAITVTGVGAGVAGAKLVAIAFGMLLHLQHLHKVVALLTAIYFAAAILPWTALFLMP